MTLQPTAFTTAAEAARSIDDRGFCLLPQAVEPAMVGWLLARCHAALTATADPHLARSSRGHVYAARNLLEVIPEVKTCWRSGVLLETLREVLGQRFGLVRVLFFDKPPDRTWALAWHKDTAIAVRDNALPTSQFSRPTVKAGVPHVIASDEILRRMLTLRIHLDEVTDENGPLQVVPGSHRSKTDEGAGVNAAVAIHAAVGDVLAMRPLLSHSSGASHPGTTRHRRILHLEFAADEQLPDGYRWHDFVASAAAEERCGTENACEETSRD